MEQRLRRSLLALGRAAPGDARDAKFEQVLVALHADGTRTRPYPDDVADVLAFTGMPSAEAGEWARRLSTGAHQRLIEGPYE